MIIGTTSHPNLKFQNLARAVNRPPFVYAVNYCEIFQQNINTYETVSEVPDGKNANTAFTENIVSDDEILINNSDAVTDASCTQKSGAFSAKFLTEVYEHPETWKNVLPAFADSFKISEDSNGKKDILELVNNSRFSAVASEYPANNWGNLDKLPADAFMDNFNDNYVREAVNTAKAKIDSSKICTGNDVVTVNAAWDKNTVSPVAAVNAEKSP